MQHARNVLARSKRRTVTPHSHKGCDKEAGKGRVGEASPWLCCRDLSLLNCSIREDINPGLNSRRFRV